MEGSAFGLAAHASRARTGAKLGRARARMRQTATKRFPRVRETRQQLPVGALAPRPVTTDDGCLVEVSSARGYDPRVLSQTTQRCSIFLEFRAKYEASQREKEPSLESVSYGSGMPAWHSSNSPWVDGVILVEIHRT